MINPRRGEVVLVLFPNSDLRTAKRRPALVLQRDDLDTRVRVGTVVVPALTPRN
jgi:mRNA interferase MazF